VTLLPPRRYVLRREVDQSGISGTGDVADGIVWPDGTTTLRWRGQYASVAHWANLAHVEAIHGHGGLTRIVWVDQAEAARTVSAEQV
jgi:hypothetical protein